MNYVDWFYQRKTPQGLTDDRQMKFGVRVILKEAEELGIQWENIPGTDVFRLMWNDEVQFFRGGVPSTTSAIGREFAKEKDLTKRILESEGISTPKGYIVRKDDSDEYVQSVFQDLKQPLVAKPVLGAHGVDVSCGIQTIEHLTKVRDEFFSNPSNIHDNLLVEEEFQGKEYRVLATINRVIGILHRVPANVVGDGSSSISQLIAKKNTDPRRGTGFGKYLKPILVDEDVVEYLQQQQQLTLDSIPKKDEQIFLRTVSNVGLGGDPIDYTDIAHSSVADIILHVMRSVPGLSFAGVDFMTSDITKKQSSDSYVIIEVNHAPGFCMHDAPFYGENRFAVREFLYTMFPALRDQ